MSSIIQPCLWSFHHVFASSPCSFVLVLLTSLLFLSKGSKHCGQNLHHHPRDGAGEGSALCEDYRHHGAVHCQGLQARPHWCLHRRVWGVEHLAGQHSTHSPHFRLEISGKRSWFSARDMITGSPEILSLRSEWPEDCVHTLEIVHRWSHQWCCQKRVCIGFETLCSVSFGNFHVCSVRIREFGKWWGCMFCCQFWQLDYLLFIWKETWRLKLIAERT